METCLIPGGRVGSFKTQGLFIPSLPGTEWSLFLQKRGGISVRLCREGRTGEARKGVRRGPKPHALCKCRGAGLGGESRAGREIHNAFLPPEGSGELRLRTAGVRRTCPRDKQQKELLPLLTITRLVTLPSSSPLRCP